MVATSSPPKFVPISHSRTVHLDIIKAFYLPTDAQKDCFKNNIKMYIKTAVLMYILILFLSHFSCASVGK